MKDYRILLLISLFIFHKHYGQRVISSTSTTDRNFPEGSNLKIDVTKIYNDVDVKPQLKSGYHAILFDFSFTGMNTSQIVILKGTIERDGTITGLNYSTVEDQKINYTLRKFFRQINENKIFEAGVADSKVVRSRISLQVALSPETNCVQLLVF